MPTITLSVTEDMKKEMDESRYINWSEVAREAIKEKLVDLSIFKKIVSKSKLKENDADKIADKITRSMHEKYKKKYNLA
tara:strand:- start:299 stop:535 length:237 start_codon:yes stop_codon:yes gene_type:complete